MILKVLAVRDAALDAYMRPIFVATSGVGVRSFEAEVNRAGSELRSCVRDYSLWEIASYDDSTGRFENLALPVRLVNASDLIKENGNVS